jgi:hypothetical protein
VKLTGFQTWILKKIFKKTIIQGYAERNITLIYRLIHEAAEETFYEDNSITIDNYLRHYFSKSNELYPVSEKRWREDLCLK